MDIITKEEWLKALFRQQNGGRLNQALSLMTGGHIEYVEWNISSSEPIWDATGIVYMQYQELPNDPILRKQGNLYLIAYSALNDFSQKKLEQALQFIRQEKLLKENPVCLVLLAFCRDNFDSAPQEGMLTEEQWSELLEDGMTFATGVRASLKEVIMLPLVAYQKWLRN